MMIKLWDENGIVPMLKIDIIKVYYPDQTHTLINEEIRWFILVGDIVFLEVYPGTF
jgi:hypothetical protein